MGREQEADPEENEQMTLYCGYTFLLQEKYFEVKTLAEDRGTWRKTTHCSTF